MGSFIFLEMNGKRTVKDIVILARDRFGNKVEPAETRMAGMMELLEANGLIKYNV